MLYVSVYDWMFSVPWTELFLLRIVVFDNMVAINVLGMPVFYNDKIRPFVKKKPFQSFYYAFTTNILFI